MRYYAVKSGRTVGVFDDWGACQASIKGFSGAVFKSFNTKEEAEAYLADVDIYLEAIKNDIDDGYVVAYCDGSYDQKRNRYAYGVLIIDSEKQTHEVCGASKNIKYTSSHNIIGEILGVINAMDWAVSHSYPKIKIYHDYEGISKWINGEWAAKSDAAKAFVSIYQEKYADLLQVEFEKVKGHSNNKYNDIADELAKRALTDNVRVPIAGDSWFSVPYFKHDELQAIMELISEDHSEINITKVDRPNSIIYKLKLNNVKLSVTLFKNHRKKLLVQGANSILFQIFTTFVYEVIEKNPDRIIADAYRTNIDSKKIDQAVIDRCPDFPGDYPENIKRLVRQSIINLSYYIEADDYSQYVFPALRALEGHMKYLFGKAGLQIKSKQGFCYFEKDTSSQKYILPSTIISDVLLKEQLEKYYNFYYNIRHAIFHFGDIIGSTDSTLIIETKNEADEYIKKCLSYICEE